MTFVPQANSDYDPLGVRGHYSQASEERYTFTGVHIMHQTQQNPRLTFVLPLMRSAFILLLCLSMILPFLSAVQAQAEQVSTPQIADYVPDQVLIQFKSGLGRDAASQKKILSAHGLKAMKHLPLASAALLPTLKGESVQEAMLRLLQLDAVRYAEPNYKRHLLETVPNDPYFSQQWAHQNIQSTTAWTIESGHPDVLIAVADSGIDYTHEDILDNMCSNPGQSFVGPSNNPMDYQGHGTHVAGIIGAVGNNGLGVTGVNWNVSLMALKFISMTGGSVADEVQAIEYAVQNGVRVFNMSYGSSYPSEIEKDAIAAAQDILFIAAAGNNSQDNDLYPQFPANHDLMNIISVAATDSSDQLASFSNYGPYTVDVAAPGSNIFSTLPIDGYGSYSGTSMAAPFVSGLAGLLLAHDPGLTPAQLKDRILCSADKIPELEGQILTQGRINTHQALTETVAGPEIFAINPDRAQAGAQITILGANFQDTAGQVYFAENTTARIISWRNDKIVCEVPDSAQSGDVQVVTAQGASNELHFELIVVQSHVTTLYDYLEECPQVPTEVIQFSPGDQVAAWNYIPNCNAGDQYQWVWIYPDGTPSEEPVQEINSTGEHCLSSYWEAGIPNNPGRWQVKFYYNQALQYTDTFTVLQEPPAWDSVYTHLFSGTSTPALQTLRQFRDEILMESALGQNLVQRLYDRSHEVAVILLMNPELLGQTTTLTRQIVPEAEKALQGGTGVLSQPVFNDLFVLLEAMHAEAEPKLKSLIQDVQESLQDQEILDQFGMQKAFD